MLNAHVKALPTWCRNIRILEALQGLIPAYDLHRQREEAWILFLCGAPRISFQELLSLLGNQVAVLHVPYMLLIQTLGYPKDREFDTKDGVQPCCKALPENPIAQFTIRRMSSHQC